MKKEFIVCYICMGVLAVLCVLDVVLCKWLNLFCNVLWLFITYMVLLAGERHREMRREKREREILNGKLIDIIANLAVKAGKTGTVFDKVHRARKEAYKESMEECS